MRTHLEIKRIDLWSLFKIAFILYAVLGLVFGLIYGLIMMAAGGIGTAFLDEELPGLGIIGGVVGLILIPFLAVIYGAFGSVVVTIGGWIYNICAGLAGGVRFTTDVQMMEQEPTAVDVGPVLASRPAPPRPPMPQAPPAVPPEPAPPPPPPGPQPPGSVT